MAITITNTTLSDPADKSEVEANFTDISNKFGNIDNSDIKAGAGIAASKLAASYQEVWLQMSWWLGPMTGGWPAAAADPDAPTQAELLDFVPLPGTDADTAWVVTDVSWMSNDTGTAANGGLYSIRYGAFNGSGAMIGAGDVITSGTMTAIAVDVGAQGRGLEGGSVTLTQSTTVRGLYLVSMGAGGDSSALDDAGGAAAQQARLNFTIALRRQITA